MSTTYIQMHFRLLLIMKVNTMNPDQTSPIKEQFDMSVYIVCNIYATKVYEQMREPRTVAKKKG